MQTKTTELHIYKIECLDCGVYEYVHSLRELDEKDCSFCYSENTKLFLLNIIRIIDNGMVKQS